MSTLARAALPLLLLCSCGEGTLVNRRWIGPVTPTTPGKTCTPSTGVAQVTDGKVTFAPDQGTWVLLGTLSADGTILAEHTRPGADKQPYSTTLDAKWTPGLITGTYTTPRCTFTVSLRRP